MTDTRAAAVAALAEELMMVKAQAARYDLTIDQQAGYMISRILANPDHRRVLLAVMPEWRQVETIIRTYADRLMVAYPDQRIETAQERDELLRRLTEPTDTGSGT